MLQFAAGVRVRHAGVTEVPADDRQPEDRVRLADPPDVEASPAPRPRGRIRSGGHFGPWISRRRRSMREPATTTMYVQRPDMVRTPITDRRIFVKSACARACRIASRHSCVTADPPAGIGARVPARDRRCSGLRRIPPRRTAGPAHAVSSAPPPAPARGHRAWSPPTPGDYPPCPPLPLPELSDEWSSVGIVTCLRDHVKP